MTTMLVMGSRHRKPLCGMVASGSRRLILALERGLLFMRDTQEALAQRRQTRRIDTRLGTTR